MLQGLSSRLSRGRRECARILTHHHQPQLPTTQQNSCDTLWFFAIDRSSFYIRICQQKQPVFIIFTQPNIQIDLIASFQFAKPVKTPRKMVTSEFKCISVIILTCQGVPAPQDVQTLSFYVFAVICSTSNAHSCWCEIFKFNNLAHLNLWPR